MRIKPGGGICKVAGKQTLLGAKFNNRRFKVDSEMAPLIGEMKTG